MLSRPVAVILGRASAVVSLPELAPGAYAACLSYRRGEEYQFRRGRFDVTVPRTGLDEEKLVRLASSVVSSTEPLPTCISLMNGSPLGPLGAHVEASFSRNELSAGVPFIRKDVEIPSAGAYQCLFDWAPHLPRRLVVRWAPKHESSNCEELSVEPPRIDARTSETFVVPYGIKVVVPPELTEFDSPTFSCEVWNVGSEPSDEAVVSLFLANDALAQSQLLPKLAPGCKRQMTFVSRQPLPAGCTTVTLLIQRKDPLSTITERWQTLYERVDPIFVKRGPEIEIVPKSVSADVPPDGIIARTSVRVRARLRNTGEVAAQNVRYQLMINDPTTGTEAMMLNEERGAVIPEIGPGEEIPIEARWENCNEPGSPKVWLVVNGAKTIKEKDYSNNVAQVPPFKVRQLGDFQALALDVVPKYCVAGTTVIVQAALISDADVPRGPLDVELGLRNPLTRDSDSKKIILSSISPNTTQTVVAEFSYQPNFTEAYVVVNASKELEERDSGGNELAIRVYPITNLGGQEKERSSRTINISNDLNRTVCHNIELLPGPALRLIDTPTSSSGMNPADSSWAQAGKYITQPRGAEDDTDNYWIVAPWLIEATSSEQCEPLSLRIPISPWIAEIPYDLYLHALSSANYKGGALRRFVVAGDGIATTPVDLRIENTARALRRCYIGRFTPAQPWLDLTIAQTTGSGVVIKGVEIVPAAGFVDSPIYVVSNGAKKFRKISFADNDAAATAIRYLLRTARVKPNGIEWGEWQPIAKKAAALDPQATGFQWRAVIYPQQNQLRPTLKGVLLMEGE
ncbi:MAG: hypothetical protein N2Z21_02005 [Candidatus Sumerlaeaceae bacterium]|nr:hypothetical protein [Candidatus Sumerlaeaceae bacterium]